MSFINCVFGRALSYSPLSNKVMLISDKQLVIKWVIETSYYYLYKMGSDHWANHDVTVIVDQDTMKFHKRFMQLS